jgi:hypothetical protein
MYGLDMKRPELNNAVRNAYISKLNREKEEKSKQLFFKFSLKYGSNNLVSGNVVYRKY